MPKIAGEIILLLLPSLLVGLLSFISNLNVHLILALGIIATFVPAYLRLLAERRHHQQSAKRTHEFTQGLIDVIPQPVYVKNAQSTYLMVNRAFAEDRGMTVEQLVGVSSFALSPDLQTTLAVIREDAAALMGEHVTVEMHDIHNGKDRYRLIMKGSCLNAEGQRVIVGANFTTTPWKEAEHHLSRALEREKYQHQRTQEYIQRIIDVIPYPVYVKDAQSHYLLVNQAMAQSKGVSIEALKGATGLEAVSPADTAERILAEDAEVLAGKPVFREEQRAHQVTGEEMHRIITKGPSLDADGNPVIVGAHFDLTDLRIAEKSLQQALTREVELRKRSQDFIQQLIDLIPDPVYLKDADSRYLMVNLAFAKERGFPKESLLGMTSLALAPNSEAAETSRREDQEVISGSEITKEQHTQLPITGEECYRVVIKRRCFYLDGKPVVFGLHHYITRWKVAALEFQHLSWKDPLTGIANRRHFSEEADKAIALAHRSGSPLVLAMLDLDHFKRVNDQYGHPVGDEVLAEMVRRCQERLRSSDQIGRWGGEEFIVLLPFTNLEAAVLAIERLRTAIAESPFHAQGKNLDITISCGLAQLKAGENFDQLVARTDTALYQAKHQGRNRICIS